LNVFAKLRIEWPTVALIAFCYSVWLALMLNADVFPAVVWILLTGITLTLFWSLVHEAIHGHPTSNPLLNHALMFVPLGWVFPFERFRDTHLEHHKTGELTDPFDDPESFYLAQPAWARHSKFFQMMLIFNNTLAGRLLIGPAISLPRFYAGEVRLILSGGKTARAVLRAWGLHAVGIAILVWFLATYVNVSWWQQGLAAYAGMSFLLIRTFLEHQACEETGERTVIVEGNDPFALLFLYNSLHIVHHARPGIAWYRLPGFYRRHREKFIERNNAYVYKSYWEIFRRYFFVPKEPVPHPFLRRENPAARTSNT